MPADERPIFLVGFMGCGKSASGALLADRLGWDFLDTDRLVLEREGRPIDAIFEQAGEGYFRKVEWDVVRSRCDRKRCVIATGGGLFLGWPQRRWLKDRGRTVWLDLPLEGIRRRLGEGEGRPLWLPRDPISLRMVFERRRAVYALAELRIAASPGSVEEVASRIEAGVRCISR